MRYAGNPFIIRTGRSVDISHAASNRRNQEVVAAARCADVVALGNVAMWDT
jgi:hypothetical protein